MVEAEDHHTLTSIVRREFYITRVLHTALAERMQEQLQNFHHIIQFSNLPLSMQVHDLLSQVQSELAGRGFHFYNPYDPGNPSFALLQIRSAGQVLSTFGLSCQWVTEYFPPYNETLEHLFYEVHGFKIPSSFSKKIDGTHVLRIGK